MTTGDRQRLASAGGLALTLVEHGEGTLSLGEGSDWLGPLRLRLRRGAQTLLPAAEGADAFEGSDALGGYRGLAPRFAPLPIPVRVSARAYDGRALVVFRTEATEAIGGLATGAFAEPSVAWPAFAPASRAAGGVPDGTRTYGHQYTEFALPVHGDANATGYTFAGHRPPVVEPLLFVAPDLRTLLLAPLDAFHEQIVAVPASAERAADGVRCGWHGDLARVPAGFATELAVLAAASPREALDAWASILRERAGTRRPSRYEDDGVGRLSYWTDNGAVYYYRTEPGLDAAATLEKAVATLHDAGVPVRSVQLDSWFYPHEVLRPVSAEGAPVVPPTGALRWEPREDVFPDGLHGLRERLGGLPLVTHARHFSSRSPYWDVHPAWIDGAFAHPADPAFFDGLLEQAAGWGVLTYEQDWLVECFLGVRGLREAPGRARAWQEGLDRAAAERGMTLQWCMATPADFMRTVTLTRVTSIRTSGDYRYLFDNGLNWVWFLHGNALARALGLNPYKDVFVSHGETGVGSGDAYAEIEALLAALSAGPVGIGDRIGHTNRALVMRTCREDGVLVKPDVPIAAIPRCFVANAFLEPVPLVGETHSRHPAGLWTYVAIFNACRRRESMSVRVPLADLGESRPAGPVVAYDPRRDAWQRLEPDGAIETTLGWQEHDYRILCPLLPGDIAVFGDVGKFASAGDRRISRIAAAAGEVRFEVFGAPETTAEIRGCASARPRVTTPHDALEFDAGGGGWRLRVGLGALGRARVALRAA